MGSFKPLKTEDSSQNHEDFPGPSCALLFELLRGTRRRQWPESFYRRLQFTHLVTRRDLAVPLREFIIRNARAFLDDEASGPSRIARPVANIDRIGKRLRFDHQGIVQSLRHNRFRRAEGGHLDAG